MMNMVAPQAPRSANRRSASSNQVESNMAIMPSAMLKAPTSRKRAAAKVTMPLRRSRAGSALSLIWTLPIPCEGRVPRHHATGVEAGPAAPAQRVEVEVVKPRRVAPGCQQGEEGRPGRDHRPQAQADRDQHVGGDQEPLHQ